MAERRHERESAGSAGRGRTRLCCSDWLTNVNSVGVGHAKHGPQQGQRECKTMQREQWMNKTDVVYQPDFHRLLNQFPARNSQHGPCFCYFAAVCDRVTNWRTDHRFALLLKLLFLLISFSSTPPQPSTSLSHDAESSVSRLISSLCTTFLTHRQYQRLGRGGRVQTLVSTLRKFVPKH